MILIIVPILGPEGIQDHNYKRENRKREITNTQSSIHFHEHVDVAAWQMYTSMLQYINNIYQCSQKRS